MELEFSVGPRRGRGGRGRGFGQDPGPRGPMMGMPPNMIRPNQPFDQFRPRHQHFPQVR